VAAKEESRPRPCHLGACDVFEDVCFDMPRMCMAAIPWLIIHSAHMVLQPHAGPLDVENGRFLKTFAKN